MSDDFAFVHDLFADLAPVRVRRMFGGAGIYAHDIMFALLADNVLYLKTDAALQTALAAEGSEPFVWVPESGPKAGQKVAMSYWRLPEAAWDDPEIAAAWGRRALDVALAAAKAKKPTTKSPAVKKSARARKGTKAD